MIDTCMYLRTTTSIRLHQRESKLGNVHNFKRKRTVYHFKCDCCDDEFIREAAKVPSHRASNDFHHVCSDCDAQTFAQKVGVKLRRIYKMDASSTLIKL